MTRRTESGEGGERSSCPARRVRTMAAVAAGVSGVAGGMEGAAAASRRVKSSSAKSSQRLPDIIICFSLSSSGQNDIAGVTWQTKLACASGKFCSRPRRETARWRPPAAFAMNVVTLKYVHPEDSVHPSPIHGGNWQTATPWIGSLLLFGRRLVLVLLAAAGCAFSSAQVVNYPLETGYGRLCARWHYPFTINGATITVGQAEGNLNGAYLPDVANPDFAHVIFQVMDGDSPVSGHATDVGTLLYGIPLSLSPAVPEVKLYKADLSLNSGFLVSPTGLNWLDPAGPVD